MQQWHYKGLVIKCVTYTRVVIKLGFESNEVESSAEIFYKFHDVLHKLSLTVYKFEWRIEEKIPNARLACGKPTTSTFIYTFLVFFFAFTFNIFFFML